MMRGWDSTFSIVKHRSRHLSNFYVAKKYRFMPKQRHIRKFNVAFTESRSIYKTKRQHDKSKQ